MATVRLSRMHSYWFPALLALLPLSTPLAAAPTGRQLLEACEQAIANGFKGSSGLVCEWYAMPCNCAAGKSEPAPRVCLPEDYDIRSLAREVTAGLKSAPELRDRNADTAVAIILSRRYPCRD